MRAVLRRISPWSAAKVGAVVGVIHGLLAGILATALSGAMASALTYFNQPISPLGWAAVILFGILGGAVSAVLFAITAIIYNIAVHLGAALRIDLAVEEPPAAQPPQQQGPLLQGPLLDKE